LRLPFLVHLGPAQLSCLSFPGTPTTESYTLSLHDALPIYRVGAVVEEHPDLRPAGRLHVDGSRHFFSLFEVERATARRKAAQENDTRGGRTGVGKSGYACARQPAAPSDGPSRRARTWGSSVRVVLRPSLP